MSHRTSASSWIGLFTLAAQPALGHDLTVSHGPYIGAAAHVLTEFDHIAAFVCVGLLGGLVPPDRRRVTLATILLLSALSLVGMAVFPVTHAYESHEAIFSATSLMSGGAWVAIVGARLPMGAAIVAAIVALIHGGANGVALNESSMPILAILGAASAIGVLVAAGGAFTSLARWPSGRIAIRVLGSWVFALGLLQLGLVFRG